MQKKKTIFLEIFIFFLLCNLIGYFLFPQDPGYNNFRFHPYWIGVLFISVRYGFFAALWVSLIAAFHSVYFLLKSLPSLSSLDILYEKGDIFLPLSFLVIGFILGRLRQRQIDIDEKKTLLLKEKENVLKQKEKECNLLERTRYVLEARLATETSTIKVLYEVFKGFETFKEEDILQGCLQIMVDNFQIQAVTVYVKEGDYFLPKASKGVLKEEVDAGKIAFERSIMSVVVKENKMLTASNIVANSEVYNKFDDYNKVIALFPLNIAKGAPEGVVNISRMDFLFCTEPIFKSIELIVNLTGQAMFQNRIYKLAKEQMIFDEYTGIYTFNYFLIVFEREYRRAVKFSLPLTLSFLKIQGYGFFEEDIKTIFTKTVMSIIRRYFPETDLFFHYRYEGVFALLSPLCKEEEVRNSFAQFFKTWKDIFLSNREFSSFLPCVGIAGRENCHSQEEMVNKALKECRIFV